MLEPSDVYTNKSREETLTGPSIHILELGVIPVGIVVTVGGVSTPTIPVNNNTLEITVNRELDPDMIATDCLVTAYVIPPPITAATAHGTPKHHDFKMPKFDQGSQPSHPKHLKKINANDAGGILVFSVLGFKGNDFSDPRPITKIFPIVV
jgi:hypothetical protein